MAAPNLDGTATGGANGVGNAFTVSLSTSSTNEDVFLLANLQAGTGSGASGAFGAISSISDTAGLNWQRLASLQSTDGSTCTLELWWAPAPSVLSSETVSVFLAQSNRYAALVFAAAGSINLNSPFDPNASLPAFAPGGATPGASPPISTNQARSLLLLCCGVTGNASAPSFGSPFTFSQVQNGTFVTCFLGYQQRNTQANNVQAVVTGGGGAINGLNVIGIAIAGPGWLRADVHTAGF